MNPYNFKSQSIKRLMKKSNSLAQHSQAITLNFDFSFLFMFTPSISK